MPSPFSPFSWLQFACIYQAWKSGKTLQPIGNYVLGALKVYAKHTVMIAKFGRLLLLLFSVLIVLDRSVRRAKSQA